MKNMHVAVEQISSRVIDQQGDETITGADGLVTYIKHLPASHYAILLQMV